MAEEKYRTQLTGAQVDDALHQLNQRVAEGWAVGTRDGSPVGSGTEYYHNNAKYWAEQSHSSVDAAEAAAERAEAAVPAGTAGAVFFDRAQSLTDTQKEQARKNIAAGGTNPNLLDNSWWGSGEVVNQRGVTSASLSSAKYYIDRWTFTYGSNAGSFVLNANGLAVTIGDNFQCIQAFENVSKLNGRMLTASVMLSDGTIYSGTITRTNGTQQVFYNANNVYIAIRSSDDFFVRLTANMTIRAVKLELGSFSTLAYDTPPDYGEELTRCIYSTADPTDTYANNGFGRTNPNLLDNWYLAGGGTGENFPINQRGAVGSSISTSGYFIDRWKSNAANNVGIFPGYVRILAGGGMRQYLPLSAIKKGVYTVSVMLEGGQVYSMTGILDPAGTSGTWQLNKHLLQNVLWCGVRVDNGKWDFDFTSTNSANVVAVKAEAGTISTLANDVPPNYAEELAKCQRYAWLVKTQQYEAPWFGFAINTATVVFDIVPPVPMRAGAATFAVTGTFYISQNGSAPVSCTIGAINAVENGNLRCSISGTFTSTTIATIYTSNNAPTILISRDL